jgi:site-specific recombinase XerD
LQAVLRAWFLALRTERGVSPHTLSSYKVAWRLLVSFGIEQRGLTASGDWRLTQIDRDFVLAFLLHLEKQRACSASTRNVRLAAVQSFFRWLSAREPALHDHGNRILGIPNKRTHRPLIEYLERDELQAVLAAVNIHQADAGRDLALLCLAYNSGARAQELADVRVDWLRLSDPATIRIWGKGRKERELPLWKGTVYQLKRYLKLYRRGPADAIAKSYLFLNHRGQRMTRWGIAGILEQAFTRAATVCPTLASKHLSAHSMRHTTAVHLLQSGVDLVTIQNWLGHNSPDTVHTYLALDLKSRRDLLERCLRPEELLPPPGPDDDWISPL